MFRTSHDDRVGLRGGQQSTVQATLKLLLLLLPSVYTISAVALFH
jgi:hypothetical protein